MRLIHRHVPNAPLGEAIALKTKEIRPITGWQCAKIIGRKLKNKDLPLKVELNLARHESVVIAKNSDGVSTEEPGNYAYGLSRVSAKLESDFGQKGGLIGKIAEWTKNAAYSCSILLFVMQALTEGVLLWIEALMLFIMARAIEKIGRNAHMDEENYNLCKIKKWLTYKNLTVAFAAATAELLISFRTAEAPWKILLFLAAAFVSAVWAIGCFAFCAFRTRDALRAIDGYSKELTAEFEDGVRDAMHRPTEG